jgi:parallel beta-helix repeat protein
MASATTDRRQGLTGDKGIKAPVLVATTGNIILSGEQTIDGVAVKAVGVSGYPDRVLVWKQNDPATNGIWDVSTASWTRSQDANGTQDIVTGTIGLITSGTLYANQQWVFTTTGVISFGSTALNFQVLRRWRTPYDFGCVGDGIADDTVNFQKMVDTCPDIDLAAGTFKISRINFPNTFKRMRGRGAASRIVAGGVITPGNPFLFFNLPTNIDVGDFVVNISSITYPTILAFQFGAVNGGLVSNILIEDGAYIAVYAPGCTGVIFDNITVTTFIQTIFLAESSPSNLTVKNIRSAHSASGHGIGIQGGQYHSIENCFVTGNGASFFSINLYQSSNSTIKNCRVFPATREGIQVTDGSFNRVIDNFVLCQAGHNDFGISIFADGVDIKGNQVSGNFVIGSGGSGIGVSASYTPVIRICQLNSITDNFIANPNQRGDVEGSGVLLLGGATCTGNIVANNTCTDESNKMRYGVNEWNSGGNPNNNKLINNSCFGGAVFISEGNVVGPLSEVYDLAWQNFATTVTSQTGTITTVNTALTYFKYKRAGREARISARAAITTNGTGAASVQMSMPFTMQGGILSGRENGVSGAMLQGFSGGANLLRIATYVPAYPGANGAQCVVSGIVEI